MGALPAVMFASGTTVEAPRAPHRLALALLLTARAFLCGGYSAMAQATLKNFVTDGSDRSVQTVLSKLRFIAKF